VDASARRRLLHGSGERQELLKKNIMPNNRNLNSDVSVKFACSIPKIRRDLQPLLEHGMKPGAASRVCLATERNASMRLWPPRRIRS